MSNNHPHRSMTGRQIALTNDFHNTRATIRVPADGYISEPARRNAWHKLCGNRECVCGGVMGERMGTHLSDGTPIRIDHDYRSASNGKGAQVIIGSAA